MPPRTAIMKVGTGMLFLSLPCSLFPSQPQKQIKGAAM